MPKSMLAGEAPASNQQNPQQDEMMAQLERWTAKGWKLIHQEPTRSSLIEVVKNAENPIEGLAKAVVMVTNKLDEVSRGAKVEVNDQVKLQATQVFLDDLMTLAKVDLDEKQFKAALALAIQEYVKGEIAAGRMDAQALQGQIQEMANGLSDEEREQADMDMKDINEVGMQMYGGQSNEA